MLALFFVKLLHFVFIKLWEEYVRVEDRRNGTKTAVLLDEGLRAFGKRKNVANYNLGYTDYAGEFSLKGSIRKKWREGNMYPYFRVCKCIY